MTDSSSVLSGWWGFKGATSGDWPGCTLWARAQSDTGKENIESFQHQWTMKNHEGSIHTKNAHTLIYTIHTHTYTPSERVTCKTKHRQQASQCNIPSFRTWYHSAYGVNVCTERCCARWVYADKQSSYEMAIFQKSWLQSDPFHHIFDWPVINFSCQNDYPENSSLQGFAGKRNHLLVPVWMYKQLDWRLESVLDKLELTLTDVMCRAFFSWCGNLALCRDHLSAPIDRVHFQKSRLGDVLMGGAGNGDFCPANMHKPIKTCPRWTVIKQLQAFKFALYQPVHRKHSLTVFSWPLLI